VPDDPFERLHAADPSRDARDALDVLDPDGALRRPRPGHPLLGRVRERAAPWVTWFGLRRLVATAVTVVVVVAAGWWLLRAPAPPTEAGLAHATSITTQAPAGPSLAPPTTVAPAPTTPSVVVVHVAGAVATPGVYELPGDARADDAVAAAGGSAPGAELDALNLAAPLRDGERIYVPREGEDVPPPAAPVEASATVPAGPVDLNRATIEQLDALPGIGPSTAMAIVAHRDTNGPFATVDDLEQVRGIGPAKLEAIRPLVTL
jgi:competence protein ComEA